MTVRLIVAAIAAVVAGASAHAQSYPSRAVTIIAPFPAGGPLDTIARIVAEPMREALGQPVLVENVAGAGGNIGTLRVARAAPDGYTIGIGQWSTHVVNPITYSLQYDVFADFEPVGLLTITPQLIIARKDFPAKDIKELIAWLKANPDKATAATVGAAGGAQMSSIYFQDRIGTKFRFVPYRGGGPAVQDMAGGRVDLMLDQAANALGPVRSGTVKAYAVMAKERWAALPDVPTIDEAGAPGLYVAYWHAMWAPKGTPKDVIARLNAAVGRALADPATSKRLSGVGHDVFPAGQRSPAALAAYHKTEADKWWPIVRATGLKAQ
ncbi:MAG: tripartite tricarboxylate transporter substrate binding protein BugD [Alphaproteobacteria bacterium]|nr:tripartite tricarboxylate transporter substrate binding protein BugD [Alphaproteobacteria bacterium]